MPSTKPSALDLSLAAHRTFLHLLVNTLVVSVINFTVWFAITFLVFLETRSVLATGLVAGIFLVATASSGTWFGSLVDHYRKKRVMQASALISLAVYVASFVFYQSTPESAFTDVSSARLWSFVVLTIAGVITGNIRAIAMQTLVTP
jgi:DHA3 family multidrug efflux protein-like MFS transporter